MFMVGELSYFLGLQVTWTKVGMFISQIEYLRDMLKRFGMEDCANVSTPMTIGCKLSKGDESLIVNATLLVHELWTPFLALLFTSSCVNQVG